MLPAVRIGNTPTYLYSSDSSSSKLDNNFIIDESQDTMQHSCVGVPPTVNHMQHVLRFKQQITHRVFLFSPLPKSLSGTRLQAIDNDH